MSYIIRLYILCRETTYVILLSKIPSSNFTFKLKRQCIQEYNTIFNILSIQRPVGENETHFIIHHNNIRSNFLAFLTVVINICLFHQSVICEHVHIHTQKNIIYFGFADVKIKNVVHICCFVMTVPFSSSYSVGKKRRAVYSVYSIILMSYG